MWDYLRATGSYAAAVVLAAVLGLGVWAGTHYFLPGLENRGERQLVGAGVLLVILLVAGGVRALNRR